MPQKCYVCSTTCIIRDSINCRGLVKVYGHQVQSQRSQIQGKSPQTIKLPNVAELLQYTLTIETMSIVPSSLPSGKRPHFYNKFSNRVTGYQHPVLRQPWDRNQNFQWSNITGCHVYCTRSGKNQREKCPLVRLFLHIWVPHRKESAVDLNNLMKYWQKVLKIWNGDKLH